MSKCGNQNSQPSDSTHKTVSPIEFRETQLLFRDLADTIKETWNLTKVASHARIWSFAPSPQISELQKNNAANLQSMKPKNPQFGLTKRAGDSQNRQIETPKS